MRIMKPKLAWFDIEAFYADVEKYRAGRLCSWKQAAEETGLQRSTFSRLNQGHGIDLDNMAALATWAGLDPNDYTRTMPGRIAEKEVSE